MVYLWASMELDFLAIGDITTDAFIRLKDASIHCDVNKHDCQICLNYADKVPFEFVEIVKAVGNSPNAAVSATRLGLKTALLSNIGDDENGKDCLKTLQENNIDTRFVITNKGAKTNYHYVLWYEDDRTILVKQEPYKYTIPENLPVPRWIYLSSVGHDTLYYHNDIVNYLKKHPETKLTFQPGTYQMKLGTEKLKALYEESDIFVCNVEESERILGTGEMPVIDLMKGLAKLGPKIVVVTDGPKGAYAYDNTGGPQQGTAWFMPIYPDPKPPYERTGAGDSFASTFTAAIAYGKTIEEALLWAPVNPMSVVQHVGAQTGLLTRPELEKLLVDAPDNYKPHKIN